MKKYDAFFSMNARQDMNRIFQYIEEHYKNPQAVTNLWKDFQKTRETLEIVAGSIKEPMSSRLKAKGLKRINCRSHGYFFLYRIEEDRIEIVSIFNEKEDFENKLR